jgi:hypothetical protein
MASVDIILYNSTDKYVRYTWIARMDMDTPLDVYGVYKLDIYV